MRVYRGRQWGGFYGRMWAGRVFSLPRLTRKSYERMSASSVRHRRRLEHVKARTL